MDKQKTMMDVAMQQSSQAASEKQAADEKMWGGIGDAIGGVGKMVGSDERLKENIVRLR